MGGTLHLLPADDALAALLAARRAHVVIEGEDLRPNRCGDERGTMRVVAAHDFVVIEEFEAAAVERTLDELEPVGRERAPLVTGKRTTVGDGKLPRCEVHAAESMIAALRVTPGEHLAVAKERRARCSVEIPEHADGSRAADRSRSTILHDPDAA